MNKQNHIFHASSKVGDIFPWTKQNMPSAHLGSRGWGGGSRFQSIRCPTIEPYTFKQQVEPCCIRARLTWEKRLLHFFHARDQYLSMKSSGDSPKASSARGCVYFCCRAPPVYTTKWKIPSPHQVNHGPSYNSICTWCY